MKIGLIAVILIFSFILTNCSTLQTSRISDLNSSKVYMVNKKPDKCRFVAAIEGIGNEAFEGDRTYTQPLAMKDLKAKAISNGANVVYIHNFKQEETKLIISAESYSCEMAKVSRNQKLKYAKANGLSELY